MVLSKSNTFMIGIYSLHHKYINKTYHDKRSVTVLDIQKGEYNLEMF